MANTLAGLGNLGLTTAFIGRVHDDALGRFYAQTMAQEGTDFVNPPVPGGELPTSRSMIFVSPDGERSMNTYLGISSELGPDDVSDSVAGKAEILFLEGYLYDKDQGKAAFERAAQLTRGAGGLAGIVFQGFGDFGYVAATLLLLGAVAFGLPAIALTGGHYAAALMGGSPHVWALGLIACAALINAVSPERAGWINTMLALVLLGLVVGMIVVGWQTV